MLVIKAGIHKMFVRIVNREDPDLSLHCLNRPFWQVFSFQNFRKFTENDLKHIFDNYHYHMDLSIYLFHPDVLVRHFCVYLLHLQFLPSF